MTSGMHRLRQFVADMTRLVEKAGSQESELLARGSNLLRELIATDDWLPEPFALPDPDSYRQYLLYGDPFDRFSVVSFVWGPGQRTPIHDHTTWGLVGVLRGAELSQGYSLVDGKPVAAELERLDRGEVAQVSPVVGDIHKVTNAIPDQPSISIHVYGGNIGRISRNIYSETGEISTFVSGYSNDVVPNLWAA
ncbi:cysteine dioxygenase [Microbaculum sp. FT89]|uniref:cysteine dioxygenase n=1 Tax=Microbaculum sp. FT89 TaxID=3447298 RepID=UPI003F538ED4